MRGRVWMADRPQQLGRNIGVARDRAIRLDAVSDEHAVNVSGDDLRTSPRRLPRPTDCATVGERGAAAFPTDGLTTAHASRT